MSRLAGLVALPPVALGAALAVWMISTAPGPGQTGTGPEPLSVQVQTLTARAIAPQTRVWGNVRAAEHWVAIAEVQGEVVWRNPDLQTGRALTAGARLLEIDPADYRLAIAQAEADLDAQHAETGQLDTESANTTRILELERQRLALAEADIARTRTLAAQGTLPQSRLDEAERAKMLAERTVAELENALALITPRRARLAAQIARTQAVLDRAHRDLARTVIEAPYELRVTAVEIERFQRVAPGQVLIRGDALDAVEIVAQVPVAAFRRLLPMVGTTDGPPPAMQSGPMQDIRAEVRSLSDDSQVWVGQVDRMEASLDPQARTVPVVIRVADPYGNAEPPLRLPLVPNMRAEVTLTGPARDATIAIPETALHGDTVYLVDDSGRLVVRAVSVAYRQNGSVVIAEGLAPGDRLITDDVAPALPGMALHPVEAAE